MQTAIIQDLQRHGLRLLRFQKGWIRHAYAPDTEVAALSLPRGGGKTALFGHLAGQAIRPDSPTFQKGLEVLGVSASLEQSRILLSFAREALADVEDEYRWLDSSQCLTVTHKATRTRLRILSSSGKRAMGLSGFSTIFADEPGSWESRGGALMWDALRTSLGKLHGQRLLLIGTRAPADPSNWWPELLDGGSVRGQHVSVMTAPDDAPWDSWQTVRKVNPLLNASASLRKTVLRERDAARVNETLRPAYKAYRLNQQVDVSNEVLVEAADWRRVEARPAPPREGKPIVGLDIGSERSWSAAWCLWRNGRSEAYAVCPGIPDIDEIERLDAMPRGLYRKLREDGVLLVDDGRRVSRPQTLIDHLVKVGISADTLYADRFVLGDLKDAVDGRWPVVARVTRWSEATEDIAGFRRLVKDGPFSVVPEAHGLVRLGMSQAVVVSDDQGSVRLKKRRDKRSRDDVAVAGVLAAGALSRALARVSRPRWRYRGAA